MTKTETMVAKTFSARWLMSVAFSITLCCGFLCGKVTSEAFISVVSVVVTFYFSKSPSDLKTEVKP